MTTAPTPEIAARLGHGSPRTQPGYPVSLAIFQLATAVPVALAVGGVELVEGPHVEAPTAWMRLYGLEYAMLGLGASAVALATGLVALVHCGRRRATPGGRAAFRICLSTGAVLVGAVVAGYLRLR